jgi:hypothetical protein
MILTCPDAHRPPLTSPLLILLCGIVLYGALWFPSASRAQVDSTTRSAMGPTRYDDIGWHEVIFLNFDSEKARRAKAMTERCLSSASSTRDRMPVLVETPSGPWDVLMIYPLEGAPLQKKWKTPAELEKLRSACAEAFGDDKAEDAWNEYEGLIVQSSSIVGLSGRFGRSLERP